MIKKLFLILFLLSTFLPDFAQSKEVRFGQVGKLPRQDQAYNVFVKTASDSLFIGDFFLFRPEYGMKKYIPERRNF